MFSTLLSLAFGVAGFLVFYFGFGAPWQFSLIIAGVTAIGMWVGDRATTTRSATNTVTGTDGAPGKSVAVVRRTA